MLKNDTEKIPAADGWWRLALGVVIAVYVRALIIIVNSFSRNTWKCYL